VTRKHFAALALVPAALVVAVAMVLPAGAADAPGPAGPASWGAKLSCTANSAGYCTVAHPAGVVPDAVVVTPATAAMTSVDQLTAATFRVRFYRAIAATGAVAGLPGPHTFYVHVDWTAGVPSPQPSASNTGGPSSSPSAGPSPSGPASPSPSAQPSLSPSASPSAPPAPSPSPTDPAGWPGPDNTGVPAGVTLTAYAGPCTITAANTVIDAADVACDLDIRAPGVTISRSRIHGEINGGEGTGSSFLVEDSEVVNGKRAACQCVGSDHFTMLRVEVTGGNRGVYCRLDCTVRDSWIHGTDLLATQHASAVRVEQHSTVVHNTLQCDWTAITDSEIGCSADLTGYPDFAPIHDNTISANLFKANPGGLGFCAYGGGTAGKPYSSDPANATNIVFTGNVFERGPNRLCGQWGPITDFATGRPGNVWTANTWDTGEPVAAG
jgi:hypothetical protein